MAHRRWTDEDLLEHLRTWLDDGGSGRIVDYRAWAARRDAPGDPVVSQRLGGWRRAIAAARDKELARRYTSGVTTKELALDEGVDPTTIRRRLARSGISRRRRGAPRRYPTLDDEAWLRRRYLEDGLSTTTLAREVGCNADTVRAALIRFGIPRRRRGPHDKRRV